MWNYYGSSYLDMTQLFFFILQMYHFLFYYFYAFFTQTYIFYQFGENLVIIISKLSYTYYQQVLYMVHLA